ncbi:hypothetical protein, partial [Lysobacter antibioticus]|uniref:hypothetical protein n=1 Tax=Lysobacter antibioticus TaxID=84531 RepID=UPI001F4656CA
MTTLTSPGEAECSRGVGAARAATPGLQAGAAGFDAAAFAFAFAFALALALAVVAAAVAVRSRALAKAMEDPEGGAQGCAPFFIGTG